jgi:hypothetical protein
MAFRFIELQIFKCMPIATLTGHAILMTDALLQDIAYTWAKTLFHDMPKSKLLYHDPALKLSIEV